MLPSRVRGIALAAVLSVLLGGCGLFDSDASSSAAKPTASLTPSPIAPGSAPTPKPGPAEASLARYYRQRLTWKPCRKVAECAELRVPLDYAKPGGASIVLSLLKVAARSKSRRLGSMVVNPGGPGGSGVDYAASAETVYGKELREVFDVVGFDPRGVARSTPVDCAPDSQINALLRTDPAPDNAAEARYSDGLLRAFGKGCLARSGPLARHMSTVEVAQDLDILRAALGDAKLTYFGASYGTAIGSTYAGLFPKRVGRMVLDGALDPTSSTLEMNLVQARGFEVALRAYVGACVSRGKCPLGSTVDAGTRRIRTFLDGLEKAPLRTSSGRMLDLGNAVYGVWQPLYDARFWPVLDTALRRAFDGDGTLLMLLADAYLRRGPDGRFTDNSFEAFYAVSCLDRDDAPPSSRTGRYLARFEKASPTFGAYFDYAMTGCSVWPVHSGRTPAPARATGAPPILVVGTTRDPATPLVWARSLARQLGGVLVTRNGDGHTGYRQGSRCVDGTVEAYLVSGIVPPRPVTC